MTVIGYTMMCEQTGPKELVRDVQLAEAAGFDFAVISDHYFPWVEAMGHSPYAWSVLGAAAQATSRIELMTYVTCPIKRYHPAVVAQKAATVGLLSDGRFTLGLGAGENLNEHVTGGGWPPVNVRHQMLDEAVEIIRLLWAGGYVNFDGRHFQVDSAKLWDLPDQPLKLGIAASGRQSGRLAGRRPTASSPSSPRRPSSTPSTPPAGRASHGSVSCPSATTRTGTPPSSGPGAVRLVRGRVEGQCGAAGHGGVRGGLEPRATRRYRRRHPVRGLGRGGGRAPSRSSPTPASPTWRCARSVGTPSRASSSGGSGTSDRRWAC